MRYRRAALVAGIIVAALTATSALTGAASSAEACDINSHCYVLLNGSASVSAGDHVTVEPQCFNYGSGAFTTTEEWLVGGSYWIEAGFIAVGSGISVAGITSPGIYRFWADARPGGGFHGHVFTADNSLTKSGFYIWRVSSSQFEVQTHIAGGAYLNAYSVSNSLAPTQNQYGIETSNNTNSTHANYTDVQYMNSGGTWVSSPGTSYGTQAFPSGGHYTWVTVPTSFKAAVWSGC